MKRQYRLRDQERFRELRQKGATFSHPVVVLSVLPNGKSISRCGFVVSRRIGKAVVRNRTRRRLSEVVRLLWDLIAPGWDMIWIARPPINQAEFSDLEEACVRLLRKAGILHPGVAPVEGRSGSYPRGELVSQRQPLALGANLPAPAVGSDEKL